MKLYFNQRVLYTTLNTAITMVVLVYVGGVGLATATLLLDKSVNVTVQDGSTQACRLDGRVE